MEKAYQCDTAHRLVVSAPPIPTLVQNCQHSSNLQIPLGSDAPEQASHSRQAFKLGNVGLDSEGWDWPTALLLPVLGMDFGGYLCKFRHGSLGSCAGESSGEPGMGLLKYGIVWSN